MMNNVKLVFDIDDTICNNKNRDYENATPFKDVIKKINKLHQQGAKITLYTSRGMVSCNGNIDKIIKKNKAILERWLEKNKVEYDELIFGKPLGDMYVDDKAINLLDFIKQDFEELSGHSGYKVIRLGNLVKKEMSEDNYIKLMNWYKESKNIANSPIITSNLYSTVYMEYIDGENAYNCLDKKILDKIINQILKFKDVKYKKFNKDILLNKLEKHKSEYKIIDKWTIYCDEEWNYMVNECQRIIERLDLNKYASLSHYDMTLANIIVKDNDIYLLDSLLDKEASSYLLDFAKLKMSLDGYEELFCNGRHINKRYSRYLSKKLKKMGILEIVNVLEYMWSIRLYNYNDDKELVKRFAKEREKEIDNRFYISSR